MLLGLAACSGTPAGAPDSGAAGSEDSGAGPADAAVVVPPITTPAELATATADAFCDLYLRCSGVPDLATCKDALHVENGADWVQALADQNAGKLTFDGANAAACVAAIRALGCDSTPDFGDPASPCNNFFQGTVASGGACLIDWECADGLLCSKSCGQACCAGTCVAPSWKVVPVGGECGLYTEVCTSGSWCRDEGLDDRCRAFIAAGASCTFKDKCVSGYLCTATETTAGTCAKRRGLGEDCLTISYGQGVTYGNCGFDTYCDRTTNKCVARKKPGASCDPNDVFAECVGYASCEGTPPVCLEAPGSGDPCGATDQPHCLLNLDCLSGTCQFTAETACP
jgi:hypothetical protein